MSWHQQTIELTPRSRGLHSITTEVLAEIPELKKLKIGLLHLFIQHTSASLTINENADPDVPEDLESVLSVLAPENFPYRHTCEGTDDMPAHVKGSLMGCELTIPIRDGQLCLGRWQGIFLCEHRNRAGRRRLIATITGQS